MGPCMYMSSSCQIYMSGPRSRVAAQVRYVPGWNTSPDCTTSRCSLRISSLKVGVRGARDGGNTHGSRVGM